jgi:hypothetical protein
VEKRETISSLSLLALVFSTARSDCSLSTDSLAKFPEDGKRTADGTNGVGIERYEFLSGQILAARGLIDVTELCHERGNNGLFDIHKVQNELSNRYRTVVFRKR